MRSNSPHEPSLHLTSWPKDESAAPLLEGVGFRQIRYLSLMTIDLAQPTEPPSWPTDVAVRALDEGTDLGPSTRLSRRSSRSAGRASTNGCRNTTASTPTLWFVAEDAAGIAGFALCLPELAEDPDAGYVSELGVRIDRRGEGLGLALLRQTFVALQRRGKQRASLHVDVDLKAVSPQLAPARLDSGAGGCSGQVLNDQHRLVGVVVTDAKHTQRPASGQLDRVALPPGQHRAPVGWLVGGRAVRPLVFALGLSAAR